MPEPIPAPRSAHVRAAARQLADSYRWAQLEADLREQNWQHSLLTIADLAEEAVALQTRLERLERLARTISRKHWSPLLRGHADGP